VVNDELIHSIKRHMEKLQRSGRSTFDWFLILQKVCEDGVGNMSCVRTDILCPNCLKKKLMEFKSDNEQEIWCDECGQEYIRTGPNSVRFK
jgi:hypothetical protein